MGHASWAGSSGRCPTCGRSCAWTRGVGVRMRCARPRGRLARAPRLRAAIGSAGRDAPSRGAGVTRGAGAGVVAAARAGQRSSMSPRFVNEIAFVPGSMASACR